MKRRQRPEPAAERPPPLPPPFTDETLTVLDTIPIIGDPRMYFGAKTVGEGIRRKLKRCAGVARWQDPHVLATNLKDKTAAMLGLWSRYDRASQALCLMAQYPVLEPLIKHLQCHVHQFMTEYDALDKA